MYETAQDVSLQNAFALLTLAEPICCRSPPFGKVLDV
jgi:hypothetical protein